MNEDETEYQASEWMILRKTGSFHNIHRRRLGNSRPPVFTNEGVPHPERDRQIRSPAEQGALFFVDQHRHGRPGQRIDARLPQDAAGIAAAVQIQEGTDLHGQPLAVRAVADENQLI